MPPSQVFRWDLSGVPQLTAQLDRIRMVPYGREMEEEVLTESGGIIADRWRDLAPSPGPDHPYSEGEYQDSIFVQPEERGLGEEASVLIATDAQNPYDGYPYPVALEYGTSKMAPQPSMHPAIEQAGPEALSHLAAQTKLLIEQELGGQ